MRPDRTRRRAGGLVERIRGAFVAAADVLRWLMAAEPLPVDEPERRSKGRFVSWLAGREELQPPPESEQAERTGWWRWLSGAESLPETDPGERSPAGGRARDAS